MMPAWRATLANPKAIPVIGTKKGNTTVTALSVVHLPRQGDRPPWNANDGLIKLWSSWQVLPLICVRLSVNGQYHPVRQINAL
jgi:hypothetical protein